MSMSNPKLWGPYGWYMFHTVTYAYDEITNEAKEYLDDYYLSSL